MNTTPLNFIPLAGVTYSDDRPETPGYLHCFEVDRQGAPKDHLVLTMRCILHRSQFEKLQAMTPPWPDDATAAKLPLMEPGQQQGVEMEAVLEGYALGLRDAALLPEITQLGSKEEQV